MRSKHQVAPGAVPWAQVSAAALALIAGLVLSFVGVSRGCSASLGPSVSQERYAVMASTLFAEGESISVIRQYMASMGKIDHASFVLQLADRYTKSGDRSKQRQSEELRRLGEALRQGAGTVEVPEVVTPVAAPAGVKAQAASIVASDRTPSPPAGLIKGDGVRLRKSASATAPAITLMKNGDRVEILDVVEGDQVEKNEKRWYKVQRGQAVGYVYYTLITPAD